MALESAKRRNDAQVGRAWPPTRRGCRQVRGDPGPGGVVEIGVVASGAHGSRNRADEPCFARGGSTSQTPSNFVTKREDAAPASKSFLRTCAPAAGVDDVLSTVVSLPPANGKPFGQGGLQSAHPRQSQVVS